jgi:hypothetical protein
MRRDGATATISAGAGNKSRDEDLRIEKIALIPVS